MTKLQDPFSVRILLAITVILLLATWLFVGAQERSSGNTKTIQLAHLNQGRVIGSLGRALGEVVTIKGVAVDENHTRRKADTGEILLSVQAVNGKALKHEVILPFHLYSGLEMGELFSGMTFKLVGYETGGFFGIPEAAFAYVARAPTSGYHFTSSFVILRDDSGGRVR